MTSLWALTRSTTKRKERLTELTYFRFYGQRNEVEWLVAGLGTPSLRELRISAMHFSSTSHIPSLSKFIRVAGIIFFAAKFTISGSFLMTFLFSRPRSIDNPPAKVVTINATFVAHLGSGPRDLKRPNNLALDDIFISLSDTIPSTSHRSPIGDHERWGKLFEELHNMKFHWDLYHGLEMEFVDLLRTSTVNIHLHMARDGSGYDNIFGVAD